MIIFLISTSYLTIYQLSHYCTELKSGETTKWGCDASPTFKYWDMFLVAVQIMLSNVRAERECDWLAHLMSS